MIKIILLLTTALFFLTLITLNKQSNSFKIEHIISKDTLPIIDTVGEGNWQHSLRRDSVKNLNRDSSGLKHKRDSLGNNFQQ